MPDKTPKKPFNLHADPKDALIRDKDNVETRLNQSTSVQPQTLLQQAIWA